MRWKFLNDREAFHAHREQWDALNATTGNHILLDSGFWDPLVRLFGHDELYLAICEDPAYPAMILIEHVGAGRWTTFQPSQAPLGPILFGNPLNIEQQMAMLVRSLPGFTISLGITQQDPDYTSLKQGSSDPRLEFLDYITIPRISIVDTFESYWKQRGKDLVGNLARRKKRLDEQGVKISLSVDRTPQGMDEAVRIYGQFEESGWKGENGTAVSATNSQGVFYREMLAQFCQQGEGVVYQLLMDEVPIASNLCVERGGMLIMLKTAYDEKYKKLSPSFIMLEDMLKRLFADKTVQVLEFYGRSKEWHKKWTDEERTMYHINCYRYAMVSQARKLLKTQGLLSGKSG
ncbi:GNAT family N-acetyltransferase [Candidatus Nitrospira salsa]